MAVRYPQVSRFPIGILGLVVLFILVRIIALTKDLKLGKEPKIVGSRGDIPCRIAVVAGIIRVLGDRFHNGAEICRQGSQQSIGRGAGGGPGIAQDIPPHVGGVPSSNIASAGVHVEIAAGGLLVAILVITEGHQFPTDFPDSEVGPLAAFLPAVVIEANDKGINRLVGESKIAHLPVDADALGISHTPHIGSVSSVAGGFDSGPGIRVQGGVEQVHGDSAGLGGRGSMVRPGGHSDRDSSRAIRNGSYGDGGPAHAHSGNAVVIGGSSHGSISRAGNGDGPGPGGIIQGQAGPV